MHVSTILTCLLSHSILIWRNPLEINSLRLINHFFNPILLSESLTPLSWGLGFYVFILACWTSDAMGTPSSAKVCSWNDIIRLLGFLVVLRSGVYDIICTVIQPICSGYISLSQQSSWVKIWVFSTPVHGVIAHFVSNVEK